MKKRPTYARRKPPMRGRHRDVRRTQERDRLRNERIGRLFDRIVDVLLLVFTALLVLQAVKPS